MENQNYRKAQAIINGAFYDLMELKFGCEFVNHYREEDNIWMLSFLSDTNCEVLSASKLVRVCSPKEFQEFKILGQPITLQNLLRYLEKKSKENYTGVGYRLEGCAIQEYMHGTFPENRIIREIVIDLSKQPELWGEEKWGEILEIL